MNREQAFETLSELDDSFIAESIRYAPADAAKPSERIEHMKRKRIFTIALAAALILALGAAAYAISGIPRSTGTHHMPRVEEYTSLSDLPKIEKDVGYPVTAPERFSNGYAFKGLRVNGQAVFGEDNEVLREYYGVSVTYTKDGERDLYLELSPVLRLEGGTPPREPSERRELNGVELRLNLDHYKFVPADYEKTQEDLANEAAGHYFLSYGEVEIQEREIASVEFELGDVVYLLMDMDADAAALDTLARMAQEVIEAA